MSKKDEILNLYFEEKMNTVEIAKKVNVAKSYISKILKQDSRYEEEKQQRKEKNKIKRKEFNKENMRKARKIQRFEYDILKIQHNQAVSELSGRKTINNRTFRNWNSSIYKFNERTKEYRIEEDIRNKVSYAAPKKIKWE